MSYQYPQYPQYPQSQYPGQQPPAGAGPDSGSGPAGPAAPKADTPPTYQPLPEMTQAEMASSYAINIAAGKPPAELGVKVPDAPADFPFLMYKQDGTTKGAKDEQDKAKLTSQGYSENPPKSDATNTVTPEMLKALQDVWTKAGDELRRLTELSQQQQKQMQAAGGILGAGQQQQPQYPGQQQYQAPDYPSQTGD